MIISAQINIKNNFMRILPKKLQAWYNDLKFVVQYNYKNV